MIRGVAALRERSPSLAFKSNTLREFRLRNL